uniref:Family with sequence similarity 219 member A n=1 Tax=Bos taurus TaxID=9913 RepID=A0AAA9SHB9_BOVIN
MSPVRSKNQVHQGLSSSGQRRLHRGDTAEWALRRGQETCQCWHICQYEEDPAAASISDGDCDAREEKQRELARKGSLKNGSMGSPVNQQPKKNNVMARTRLVVPNKGYSSLDQSPDEKPLVALDTDSDDDFDMSRYSSSGYSSAEQINQDLNIQLLKDGYRLDEIPDDEDLDLIPPKSVNPTCMCCQATSSTACHIQ